MVLCNAILVVLCFLAGRKEFSETIPLWQPRAGFIFFTFMPTTITLAQGQDSLLLLLILCLTWKLLEPLAEFRRRAGAGEPSAQASSGAAGGFVCCRLLWLALRCWIRYGRGRRRGDLPAVLASWRLASLAWRAFEPEPGFRPQPGPGSRYGDLLLMPNLRGAFLLLLGTVLSSHVLFGVVCLGSLILLVWGLVVVRKLRPQNAFAFSIILTVLLSYNLEPHDLAILLLPMVLIGRDATKALARCRDVILGLPIALMIFAPSTPPGAGFTLMSAPLLASAFFIGRGAAEASGEGAEAVWKSGLEKSPQGARNRLPGTPATSHRGFRVRQLRSRCRGVTMAKSVTDNVGGNEFSMVEAAGNVYGAGSVEDGQ